MDGKDNMLVATSNRQTPDIILPSITEITAPFLNSLTHSLGVPRNVLASDEQIGYLWEQLPRVLSRIPPDSVDEGLARMCVAMATGLFDSAINYAWNAVIVELRNRVLTFGVSVIPQITGDRDFDETKLKNLKSSELLQLCLNLSLMSENEYFMLNQCRDLRNNFSSSHPSMGQLDEYEVLTYLNRVVQIALQPEQNPEAVDIQEFIRKVKGSRFTDDQRRQWLERTERTYEAQRETLIGMLHGMYCDPNLQEHVRLNAIDICKELIDRFSTPSLLSNLINRHAEYQAKGDTSRLAGSRQFFERLEILQVLPDSERHAMVSNACKTLLSVHQAFDNFYNEPPFAERLQDLTSVQQVPESAKQEYVETVITCSVGNRYGTSIEADKSYVQMVKSFSSQEIQHMLDIPRRESIISKRINDYPRCKRKFKALVECLEEESIPASQRSRYEYWIN